MTSLGTPGAKPPLKIFAAVHLLSLCGIHAFITEGSERLRKEVVATVQLISIGQSEAV